VNATARNAQRAAEHFGRHLAVLCTRTTSTAPTTGQSRARHRRERNAVIAFIVPTASIAVGGYDGERKGASGQASWSLQPGPVGVGITLLRKPRTASP
jgi:hypothetical protein